MRKLITEVTVLFLALVFSTTAMSANPPEAPGAAYGNGPLSPIFANTDLSDAEKAMYALYEGILQIAEAKIYATSCRSTQGISEITAFTDGSLQNPTQNFVEVNSLGGVLTLEASLREKTVGRGQKIDINQLGTGSMAGTDIAYYNGTVTLNLAINMMHGSASFDVRGINGFFDRYQSKTDKNFLRGSLDPFDPDYHIILDWGLQSLFKLKYPANKYWQRSKSRRDNGVFGRTVFVRDRLVGSSKCRITIDTEGFNNQDYFWQEGKMAIELINPSTPVPAFNGVF
jgi:hypothetical protein